MVKKKRSIYLKEIDMPNTIKYSTQILNTPEWSDPIPMYV